MKTLKYIILIIILTTSCNSNKTSTTTQPPQPLGKTKVQILTPAIDLGNIAPGESVLAYFKLVNLGPNPLFISEVKTSCGCTVANFPHYRIPVGDTATITVRFDSPGFYGPQHKQIYIYSNAQDSIIILDLFANVK